MPRANPQNAVEPTQKALESIPLDGRDRRVLGHAGLYIRPCKTCRSFYVQRKQPNQKYPTKVNIGPVTMKEAINRASTIYAELGKEKILVANPDDANTFSQEVARYLELKDDKLKPRTVTEYTYTHDAYLQPIHSWSLARLGSDEGRREVQRQYSRIKKQHSKAAAIQAMRLISAVYNKAMTTDSTLPKVSPTIAVEIDTLPPANAALDDDQLIRWGKAVQQLDHDKRVWWITCLLTGARSSSVSGLRWVDLDLTLNIAKFMTTKRDRYAIPIADRLSSILRDYRDHHAIPSEWVFPSPVCEGEALKHVREKSDDIPGSKSLRHTHRTRGVGHISTEISRILLGHGPAKNDVNWNYVTLALVLEPARPAANWYFDMYAQLLPDLLK
jgi:integrase